MDQEEEDKESRAIEIQARKVLENEGCPCCYPAYLEVPLRNPPEKYQKIISYWQSSRPGSAHVVLRVQLSDWERFREFQKTIRRYYQRHEKPFGGYVDKVCERQRKYQLGEDVRLQLDPDQQTPSENWMEYLDYHLQVLESLEKERDDWKKRLNDAREEAENPNAPWFERATEDAEGYQQDLEYTELRLGRHKILLQWIEQQRMEMDTGYPTLIEEGRADGNALPKAVQRAYAASRRRRQLEPPTILGEVRVWKSKSRKRTTQRPKQKAPESEPAIEDVPRNSIPQPAKRRENRPRRTKTDMPLRQLRPHRVSKANRVTDADAKTPLTRRPCGAGQKRSLGLARSNNWQSPQRLQSAHLGVITRFGRVSRRPERWGFQFDGQTM